MESVTHYVHNLDPFAIQFTETVGIRWYGLAYLTGFVASYLIFAYLAKHRRIQLPIERVGDFITWCAIGVLVGGRLGYCLFYSPELFWTFSSAFPFWGALEVHKGGMASHGGIAGVLIACWLFARKYGYSKMHLIDLTAYGSTIGFTFGRIANFINGELYGREAPASLSWAVKFPTEIYYWANYHVQELKRLAPVLDHLGPVKDAKGEPLTVNPEIWSEWVNRYRIDNLAHEKVNIFIDKIISASQSNQVELLHALQTVLTPRYPSQLIQSFLEGFLVWLLLTLAWLKPKKAGIISGIFGIGYSVARIIGEQYRMPDAHLGFQWLGMTRGQWLSVGFLLFAIGYTIMAVRSQNPVLGGLLSSSNLDEVADSLSEKKKLEKKKGN